ncbi:MAG TPA: hypothetical protein VGM05_30660 [Planctomycetaceae bacterium]|jgi:hypothetical protein
MRLGLVLALTALLAAGAESRADDWGSLRCVSQCLQTSYSETSAPQTDSIENDDGAGGWPKPAWLNVPLNEPVEEPAASTAPSWGTFPRLPGLRGVRGLTGVIGNLMQTNPHVGGTLYATEPVKGQPTSLGMSRQFFQFAAPVWSDGNDTLVFSTHVQSTLLQSNAILPTTNQAFPDQLWNIWFGTNYFHVFDNGVIGAMLVEAGSASDKPFSQTRNDSFAGTGLLIIPDGERNAWILGVQASTNSQVLYNIPIPGAAYLYSPDDDFQAIVGFPYSAVNYRIQKNIQLQLLYMFLTTVHTRISYQPNDDWQVYVGFDWLNENYALANRQDSGDRFFYYEKRVIGGWQWWWSKHLAVEIAGGFAFDRYFDTSSGFSFSLSGSNRVDVGSGPFVMMQLDYRF